MDHTPADHSHFQWKSLATFHVMYIGSVPVRGEMEVMAAGGRIIPRALSSTGKVCFNPKGLGSFQYG